MTVLGIPGSLVLGIPSVGHGTVGSSYSSVELRIRTESWQVERREVDLGSSCNHTNLHQEIRGDGEGGFLPAGNATLRNLHCGATERYSGGGGCRCR